MMHTTQSIARLAGEGPGTVAAANRPHTSSADRAVDFELVKVIDRSMLLNPVQMRRPYRTPNGRPLERGIYAVVWPPHVPAHQYDGDAYYYGPFRAWREASAFVRETIGAHR